MKVVEGKIIGFQYPDGWYMRIGQVYSSPYEPNHFLITRFEQDEFKDKIEDVLVYYKQVHPKNYENVIVDKEEHCRAWWVDENWDLERSLQEVKKWVIKVAQNGGEYYGHTFIDCNEIERDKANSRVVYADGMRIEFDEYITDVFLK